MHARIVFPLLVASLLIAAPVGAQTIVYSQTSLAGSTAVVPGLFDELGLNAGDGSVRTDLYEIFTNNTGADVVIDKVVIFGAVNTPSTAVIVGLTTGTFAGISISFPNPSDVRATATVPVSTSTSGPGCFTSTSGFTGCPITISFSPGATMRAGAQLAFGFIVPLATVTDAFLFGTDTINGGGGISSTTPPYWTGFYSTDANAIFRAGAVGNHYLVIEGSAPSAQFAGTPGQANCHGKSVSALAQQFGGLPAAASALGLPSVQALQEAIRAFCKE